MCIFFICIIYSKSCFKHSQINYQIRYLLTAEKSFQNKQFPILFLTITLFVFLNSKFNIFIFSKCRSLFNKFWVNLFICAASLTPLNKHNENVQLPCVLSVIIFCYTFRLVASNQRLNLNVEPVVWQLVRLLASHDDPGLKTKVGKLAQVLVEFQPDLRRLLISKKKTFEQAIEGNISFNTYSKLSTFVDLAFVNLWK